MVRNLSFPDNYIRIIFLAITDFCSFLGVRKKISKPFFERTTYPFTTNEVVPTSIYMGLQKAPIWVTQQQKLIFWNTP